MDEIDVETIKVTTMRDQNGNKIKFDLIQVDENGNELGTVLFNLGSEAIMSGDTITDASFENIEVSQSLSLGSSYPDVSQTLANIESSLSNLNSGVGNITASQWTENVGQGIYYNDGSVAVVKTQLIQITN